MKVICVQVSTPERAEEPELFQNSAAGRARAMRCFENRIREVISENYRDFNGHRRALTPEETEKELVTARARWSWSCWNVAVMYQPTNVWRPRRTTKRRK